ncbi:hypothetical protein GCM10008995_12200 [Halobellus salinus]|uniref:DUF7964 domain-containing protein n=1 Tax=Halobellus salinus TaxID=931585 RepID=A0A830E9W9_9EURY|nr:hypothetical protein [Halobellus salinus]GGJ03929.1 hypothetical protein GCM10008995_12200 [Halobellus salinus]SMP20791.1 hypothetical protein SAMN06265347_1084 [Halobellus salinus]
MVKGLPDRPLSHPEAASLNQSDSIGFVFPATPHSIRDDEDNEGSIYDLLITSGESVSALVYDEDKGWKVVTKTSPDNPKEAAINDVIEYRGYDIEDEEKVLKFVTELYGALDELSQME